MISWARAATWFGATAVLVGAVIAPPAVGQAAQVIQSVAIQGQAVVGATLTAQVVTSDPAAVIEYRWQRCTGDTAASCERIKKAPDAPTYTIVAADLHFRLAVRVVTVLAGGAPEAKLSDLTDVVTAAPPAPPPTPAPTPSPPPQPTPDPGGGVDPPVAPATFNESGGPPPPAATSPPALVARPAPAYLRPFPIVRVTGTLVHGGARISLLRVTAPLTAKVSVRCAGRSCHLRRVAFGSRRIRALERFLRAGTRITIRVTGAGAIGKYALLVIRDGRAPRRRDACLLPGDRAPAACPPA